MGTKRTLRIVVASPGDVQPERDVLSEVVDELNRGIADERGLTIELSRWETDAYPGFHREGPQGSIDRILKIEDCDVLIGIFWKRFGTPTKDAQSGTEHEILRAYEAWKQKDSPQIMVYFNEKAYAPPTSTDEIDQWRKVFEFKQRFPKEGLWCAYKSKPQFEKLTRNHLTQLIRHRYPGRAQAQPSESQSVPVEIAGRSVEELTEAYRVQLAERVSKVYIVGESESREMEQVFVKLNVIDEYWGNSTQAEFLGLMDSEMRQRRDPFGSFQIQGSAGQGKADDRTGRVGRARIRKVVRPDKLLSQRTQALISGAPGCGKTTLLRYLTLATLKNQCLPLFLELKTVNEEDFKQARNSLPQLLFDKAVAEPLHLQGAEREQLEEYFFSRLRAGDAAIFLDGLDEVRGTGFFPTLCAAVSEFVSSGDRNVLVISTRPYAFQARIEGLAEMEIAPLNREQVEEFLKHYYGDDPSTASLIQHLRSRRELQEFCSTPFLLSVIAQLHRSGQQIVQDRLELYRQIVLQLAVKLDSAKSLPLSRFHIADPDGALKLDFLKELACERLFMGYVNQEEPDREAARFVFTGDDLVEHAKQFLNSETRPEINPRLLAADVKGTPLLREVGTDVYAFAHLTIQEYLAAVVLARRDDCENLFCRAFFNSALASMEVLPMTMGLTRRTAALYATLEGLPESWTFINLRLRARGLSYVSPATKAIGPLLHGLADRLLELAAGNQEEEAPYSYAALHSLSARNSASIQFLFDRLESLAHSNRAAVRGKAVASLWALGGERATGILVEALKDKNPEVRFTAVRAMAMQNWGQERTIGALLDALRDPHFPVRDGAAIALERVGGARAVEAWIEILKNKDRFPGVSLQAVAALGRLGGEIALDALLEMLKGEGRDDDDQKDRDDDDDEEEEESDLRRAAAKALGQLGDERAFEPLLETLTNADEDSDLRAAAAEALGRLGDERAFKPLLDTLLGADKKSGLEERAVEALLMLDQEEASRLFLEELKDDEDEKENSDEVEISWEWIPENLLAPLVRTLDPATSAETLFQILKYGPSLAAARAAVLVGRIGGERAFDALVEAARRNDHYKDAVVRDRAIATLGRLGDQRAVETVLETLTDDDENVRETAAQALGEIGGEKAVAGLLKLLQDEDDDVRRAAAEALGEDGEEAVEALLGALKAKSGIQGSAARGLERLGDDILSRGLVKALSRDDDFVRRKAAEFVGYYSEDPQLLYELTRMAANDPADEVRNAASEAQVKYHSKLRLFGLLET